MKKIIILLLNVLLISVVATTAFGEVTGDATGNAVMGESGIRLTVSTDLKNEDLVGFIDNEYVDPKEINQLDYVLYVGNPVTDEQTVNWSITFVITYEVDGVWGGNAVTEKLPGTVTLELGLPEGYLDSVTEVEEGYDRKWVVTATHADGTTSEYDATLDENSKMVTFSIDQFSSFELAYKDSKGTSEESTTTTTTDVTPITATQSYTVVNTADK